MSKSPLSAVKARFGEDRKAAKAALVKAVQSAGEGFFTDRLAETDGLGRVSNAKLLRLEAQFKAIKGAFASREKLIDGVIALEGRKDVGYRTSLDKLSTLRLWDRYRTLKRAS